MHKLRRKMFNIQNELMRSPTMAYVWKKTVTDMDVKTHTFVPPHFSCHCERNSVRKVFFKYAIE